MEKKQLTIDIETAAEFDKQWPNVDAVSNGSIVWVMRKMIDAAYTKEEIECYLKNKERGSEQKEPADPDMSEQLIPATLFFKRRDEEPVEIKGIGKMIEKAATDKFIDDLKKAENYIFRESVMERGDGLYPVIEKKDRPDSITTLKDARLLWNNLPNDTEAAVVARLMLKSLYSESDLSRKEGFTWEDSFVNRGERFWIINAYNKVVEIISGNGARFNRDGFKTEAQALSALAFAQLTHIVAKYNEDVSEDSVLYKITGDLRVVGIHNTCMQHLCFNNYSSAETSLEVNRELWEQYWMVTKTK